MEIESEQTKKKEIELFKKRQKEELAKSNEENKKKLYLIQKNKDKSKDKIINKYYELLAYSVVENVFQS